MLHSQIQDTEHKPHKWVVVDNAGMSDEVLVDDFPTFNAALRFIRGRGDGQIMQRLDDGSITTEY